MTQIHDVVVIGAGIAGLSTAIELLQRKPRARVLVLEGIRRKNTLDPDQPGAGHSQCSGGLPIRLCRDMIGWDIPREVVMADVHRAIFEGPHERAVVTSRDRGAEGAFGLVTSRKRLDDWLLGWARKEGAQYEPHAQVVKLERNGRWRATTRDGRSFESKFLVGADGPESMVASQFLAAPPIRPEDMSLASEVYVRAPRFDRETVLIKWRNSRIQGYYWVFDAGEVVKIGVGTTLASGVNPGKENESWRAEMAQRYDEPGFLGKPLESVGGRVTCAPPLRRVTDGAHVAVVGEAARAVWADGAAGDASAFFTGRALGRALAGGNPRGYQRWWRRESYGMHMRHWRFKEVMAAMTDEEMDRIMRLFAQFDPGTGSFGAAFARFAGRALVSEPRLIGKALWRAANA